MKFRIRFLHLLVVITLLLLESQESYAVGLIRDVETEDLIKEITTPLIKAANLNEDDVNIYIVNDGAINAFVMAGQNMFINTGLIVKYEDPNVLRGVIAHEMGHIAAGHLARGSEARKEVNNIAILSYLAGIAAAIAADGDAGYAIMMGSSHIAQRLAVKHTRIQEEAADKLALQYLEETGDSPLGLMRLLEFFNVSESEYTKYIDEYALTHPVSQKRINYIKANLHKFNNAKSEEASLQKRLIMVVAKLEAFLTDAKQSLKYAKSNSDEDRYSRTVAYFKLGEMKKSLFEIDALIAKYPENGYFYELKGQILFENGAVKESIKSYKKSLEYLKNPALAKISLAGAIITLDTKDKELLRFAINTLKEAGDVESKNLQLFQELAKAYQKIGQDGLSYLALSEANLLKDDKKKAKKYAKLAIKNFDENVNSVDIVKAKDILAIIEDDEGVDDGIE